MDDKKRELLKKLQALAERGVGGEKETAKKKIDQLCKKWGIDSLDFSEEKKEKFVFKYKTVFEKKLINQIAYKVFNDEFDSYKPSYGKGSRTEIILYCKKHEGIQIGVEYEFYKDLLAEELDFFFSCFIQKHRLFGIPIDDKQIKESTLSDEELFRMSMIINGMSDKTMHTLLEGK